MVTGNPQTIFHVKISRSTHVNLHRSLVSFFLKLSNGEFAQPITIMSPYFKQAIDRYYKNDSEYHFCDNLLPPG